MSKENVAKLLKAMGEDDELRARMIQVGAGAQDSKQAMIEAITAAAAGEGYEFSHEELEMAAEWHEASADGELSDEQLEMVAGGRGDFGVGYNDEDGAHVCLGIGIQWKIGFH